MRPVCLLAALAAFLGARGVAEGEADLLRWVEGEGGDVSAVEIASGADAPRGLRVRLM